MSSDDRKSGYDYNHSTANSQFIVIIMMILAAMSCGLTLGLMLILLLV